jgi:hypothetical protein
LSSADCIETLTCTLNDVKGLLPQIQVLYVFDQHQVLAKNREADQTALNDAVDAFNAIGKRTRATAA